MSLRSQLRLANTLMTIGVLPWLLTLAWLAAFFILTPPGGPPAIPILDPLGMIGFMVMSFLFGLCVAGAGAFWSWVLTRDGEEGTRASSVFRSAVLMAMLGPLLMQWLGLKLGIWT
jgi:hypothetical protein